MEPDLPMETKSKEENKKLNVLCYFDSPTCATGFAQVSRNILKILQATNRYNFHIVGINHGGDPYDPALYPYLIYPAASILATDERYKDVYGRQRFIDMAASGFFDIVFMIQDTFIINGFMTALLEVREKLPQEKKFSIIYYFPIDGKPRPEWVINAVAKADIPIVYTEFGKRECLNADPTLDDLRVIYHGVDTDVFYPLNNKGFREKYFQKHKDKYVVLNVNRNQPRKDLHRTMAAFKLFHDKYPNTILFLLTQAQDVGGDLIEIAKNYDLEWDTDWICPAPGTYNANKGYPIEIVNQIYNASDVVVSSTLGEGFGLSIIEAMACKKPVIFPKNTALVEIIGENEERGYFIESGKTLNDYVCLGTWDNNILRPLINIYSMADKLEYVYTHQEEAKAKAEEAFKFVPSWNSLAKEWWKVFFDGEMEMNALRKNKVGRNDPCTCGSGKKYKNCHGK